MHALTALLPTLVFSSSTPNATFIRGDANLDGVVNASDGYAVTNALFLGIQEIFCDDAADSNDDGRLDLSDSIRTLHFLFTGTQGPPPAPYPDVGVDPTPDLLDCKVSLSTRPFSRSVAITDPAVIGGLTFRRVIDQLILTSATNRTALALYQQWWRLLGTNCSTSINNFAHSTCFRAEARLADTDPFTGTGPDTYVVAAVFNRFDLREGSSDCGEYRIVFGKRSGITSLFDRNLINFEARVTNPLPGNPRGCRPIVEAFASLPGKSAAQQQTIIEGLFFNGIPSANIGPILHANNFAANKGQIRTNTRMSQAEQWVMREFELFTAATGLAVRQVAVENTPHLSLVSGAPDGRAFHLEDDIVSQTPTTINLFRRPPIFRTESFAPISEVDPGDNLRTAFAFNAPLRARIQTALTNIGSSLTPENIIDRVSFFTCAGCHQLQSNAELGGGVTAPSSMGFVHVSESGELSHGLRERFLPEREAGLAAFLAQP